MPTISGSVTLVANTRSAEQITGSYEFLPWDAEISIYAVSSTSTGTARIFAGADVVMDDRTIPYVGTTIDTSAHLIDTIQVFAGTRLSLTFLSTGVPVILWLVNITPL